MRIIHERKTGKREGEEQKGRFLSTRGEGNVYLLENSRFLFLFFLCFMFMNFKFRTCFIIVASLSQHIRSISFCTVALERTCTCTCITISMIWFMVCRFRTILRYTDRRLRIVGGSMLLMLWICAMYFTKAPSKSLLKRIVVR